MAEVDKHILELWEGLRELESLMLQCESSKSNFRHVSQTVGPLSVNVTNTETTSPSQPTSNSSADQEAPIDYSPRRNVTLELAASDTSSISFVTDGTCSDRDGCMSPFSGSPLSLPDIDLRYEGLPSVPDVLHPSPVQIDDVNVIDNDKRDTMETQLHTVPANGVQHQELTDDRGVLSTQCDVVDMVTSDNDLREDMGKALPPLNETAMVKGIVEKIKAEEEIEGNLKRSLQTKGCSVCGADASGMYFGAIVCLPCKSFFIRCTKEGEPTRLKCQNDINCGYPGPIRHRCQYCRFQRCLVAGMCRKEKPEVIEPALGQSLCKVCGDIANGIHFGVNTCEGCKKFFRRGLKEADTYACKEGQACPITPRSRNACRFCRYMKCVTVGMSRDAIKMGRPKKPSDSDLNATSANDTCMSDENESDELASDVKHKSSRSHMYRPQRSKMSVSSMPHLTGHAQEDIVKVRRNSLATRSFESLSSTSYVRQKLTDASARVGSLSPQWNMIGRDESQQKESPMLQMLNSRQSLSALERLENSMLEPHKLMPQRYNSHMGCFFKSEKTDSACSWEEMDVRPYLNHARHSRNLVDNVFAVSCRPTMHFNPVARQHSDGHLSYPNSVSSDCNDFNVNSNHGHLNKMECDEEFDEYLYAVQMDLAKEKSNSFNAEQYLRQTRDNKVFWEDDHAFGERVSPIEQRHLQPRAPEEFVFRSDIRKCLDVVRASYVEMVRQCDDSSLLLDLRKQSQRDKMSSFGVITGIQQGIVPNNEAQLWFATRIPGFCNLCREDQMILLKYGSFQIGMVWASLRMFDPNTGKFHSFDCTKLPAGHPMGLFQTQLCSLSWKLNTMAMDDTEASMLCSLILLSEDYLELTDTDKIHKLYSMMLKALDAYVYRKIGKKSNRLSDLVSFIPKLRHLGIWFTHLTKFIHMDAELTENQCDISNNIC